MILIRDPRNVSFERVARPRRLKIFKKQKIISFGVGVTREKNIIIVVLQPFDEEENNYI